MGVKRGSDSVLAGGRIGYRRARVWGPGVSVARNILEYFQENSQSAGRHNVAIINQKTYFYEAKRY